MHNFFYRLTSFVLLKDYLLFIDTEATGLPKKWYLPYHVRGNWPQPIQLSWVVFTSNGKKVKEQDHYVNDLYTSITPAAHAIHGITKEFLKEKGITTVDALEMLSEDLNKYQPMVIGHFLEFDYHLVSAAYHRQQMENPIEKLPTFCIMKASQNLQQNPHSKFLRLGELYQLLFKKPLQHQHNAINDASATAECFFELVRKNEIKSFNQPPITIPEKERINTTFGWLIAVLLILFSALLIAFFYG